MACRVNSKLMALKMHYFFMYGSSAAVIPFLPIVAKQLGMSATALGTGYSILPIFIFLFNPVIGVLVDYFQNVKAFLIVLSIASSIAYISAICLPAINYDRVDATFIRVSYFNEPEALINISEPFERSCLEKKLQSYTKCKLVLNSKNKETSDLLNIVINKTYNVEQIRYRNQTDGKIHWITFYIKDKFLFDANYTINSSNVECFPPIRQCSLYKGHSDIFSVHHFWVFFTLIAFASISNHSAHYLTHMACLELLGTNSKAYGHQRLFGTISWGIVGVLTGCLNDHFENSFSFIIYIIVIFKTVDIIILSLITLSKAHISSNMSKDLRVIFFSTEILVLTFGVAAGGFLHAIIDIFEFWFLDDMGANRTLLGLSILMQCLVGELPTFLVSGWILKKFGYFLSFSYIFVGFLLCLNLYFRLESPWLVLPIDVLHGATFALFHDAMTSFTKEKAPKGTEATLLTFFGGLYFASGGLGCFLGGVGLDKLGPRLTFLSGSTLSFGCFMFFLFTSYIFKRRNGNDNIKNALLKM